MLIPCTSWGRLHIINIQFEEARGLYDESLGIYKRLGHQEGIAHILFAVRDAGVDIRGRLEEARQLCQESLEIYEKLGVHPGIAMSLYQLGEVAQSEGRNADAVKLFEDAISMFSRNEVTKC